MSVYLASPVSDSFNKMDHSSVSSKTTSAVHQETTSQLAAPPASPSPSTTARTQINQGKHAISVYLVSYLEEILAID